MEDIIMDMKAYNDWARNTIFSLKVSIKEINKILSTPPQALQKMSLEELENMAVTIAQYSLFIQNEYNRWRVYEKLVRSKYEDHLRTTIVTYNINGRSKDEREHEARKVDESLRKLYDKLIETETYAKRIDNLSMSLNMFCSIIRDIYKRRKFQHGAE